MSLGRNPLGRAALGRGAAAAAVAALGLVGFASTTAVGTPQFTATVGGLASPTTIGTPTLPMGLVGFSNASTVGAPTLGAAATTLTLTDMPSGCIYQRVGTSKAVTVQGSYTGPASVIQARVVLDGTQTVVAGCDWQNLAGLVLTGGTSSGTFSGTITVPQGGWYNVQIRDGVTNSVVPTTQGAVKWAVGMRVLLIGQSNMQHFGDRNNGFHLADPLSRQISTYDNNLGQGMAGEAAGTKLNWTWNGNTYRNVAPYNDPANNQPGKAEPSGNPVFTPDQSNTGSGDGQVFLANILRAQLNIPIGCIRSPLGNTGISSWTPPSGTSWTNVTQYVLTQANLGGADYEAALWLQGESDFGGGAASSSTITSYQNGLTSLISAVRSTAGRPNLPFGIIIVGPAGPAWANGQNATDLNGPLGSGANMIRQAQLRVAATVPGVFIAGSAADAELGSDSVHFAGISHARNGIRAAHSLLRAMGVNVRGGAGGRVVRASRLSGSAVISVDVAHDGGTDLRDANGGTTGANIGTAFRVLVNNARVTIASSAIVGGRVQLTLASAPLDTDTVQIDYQAYAGPYGNINNDNTGAARATALTSMDLTQVLTDNVPLPLLPGAGGTADSYAGVPIQPSLGLIPVTKPVVGGGHAAVLI